MKAVLFAPHNDDESLFAAYTCLHYRPIVVVCLYSVVQEGQGVTGKEREQETVRACNILGCEFEQWSHVDYRPEWEAVRRSMTDFDRVHAPDIVFAPAVDFEANGHTLDDVERPVAGVLHHDLIGHLADDVFGPIVKHYQTYTRWGGRVREGVEVVPKATWPDRKRMALECYASQIRLTSTGHHFTEPLDEWMQP